MIADFAGRRVEAGTITAIIGSVGLANAGLKTPLAEAWSNREHVQILERGCRPRTNPIFYGRPRLRINYRGGRI